MVTDLSYLRKMTEGNPDLLREMVEIFLNQVPEYAREMQESCDQENWQALSRVAHRAKSSVAIMGMHSLAEMLKDLESYSRERKNVDKFPEYIHRFNVECNEASQELKTHFTTNKT
jgi:HPt (histidine-containing phosphotransfer) domain-containing protein